MQLFATNVGRLERANDVTGLLNCLDHKSAGIRYHAFYALMGDSNLNETIISKLKEMENDRSFMVKIAATLKFAAMWDNYVSRNFIYVITEGTRDDKHELLRIIEQRGKSENEIILLTIMHGLRDKKESVRLRALSAAQAVKNRHLIPYVAGCLNENHHKVRLSAAGVLFGIGGNDVTDYLIGLLADSNIDVVSAARQYLKKIDFDLAEKALHDRDFMLLVKGMNDREPVRKQTVQKIGEEKIREGLSLLHNACSDKYREVRIEALKSIAVFKSPSSVEYVEKLLSDRVMKVRLEAVRTLESIGDQRSLIALEWGLDDRKDAVRKAAHNAIVKLSSARR